MCVLLKCLSYSFCEGRSGAPERSLAGVLLCCQRARLAEYACLVSLAVIRDALRGAAFIDRGDDVDLSDGISTSTCTAVSWPCRIAVHMLRSSQRPADWREKPGSSVGKQRANRKNAGREIASSARIKPFSALLLAQHYFTSSLQPIPLLFVQRSSSSCICFVVKLVPTDASDLRRVRRQYHRMSTAALGAHFFVPVKSVSR